MNLWRYCWTTSSTPLGKKFGLVHPPIKKRMTPLSSDASFHDLPEDAVGRVVEFIASPVDPRMALLMMPTCRRIKTTVSIRLLTRINQDLVQFRHGLPMLRTYARAKASLTHILLRANHLDEPIFLAWILAQCDVSHLSEIRLLPAKYSGMAQTYVASSSPSAVVDLTFNSFEGTTISDFHKFVGWKAPRGYGVHAALCRLPSVTHMELPFRFFQTSNFSDMLRPTGLHTLELILIETNEFKSFCGGMAPQLTEASRAIAGLQRLRVLRLRAFFSRGANFDLSSPSVEVVDCRKTGKRFCLNSVNCLKLRELHVNGESYGTGVRRLGPDGTVIYAEQPEIRPTDAPDCPVPRPVRIPARGNTWVNYNTETRVRLPNQCDVIFHADKIYESILRF